VIKELKLLKDIDTIADDLSGKNFKTINRPNGT
jgi:hypothetical protein